MRKFVSILTLAAAVAAAPIAYAQTPSSSGSGSTAKPAGQSGSTAKPAGHEAGTSKSSMASHTTNGTVKSVDASSLVITKSGSKPQDMTFALDASTQKQGTLEVGSMVTVHYKTEGSTNTATAVTAKAAKPAKADTTKK